MRKFKKEEIYKSEIFTLWADDSQRVSVKMSERFINEFKAHLVLNYIFHDTIVLSDSQAITCRNFRHLISRGDAVVRYMVEREAISIAMRNKDDGKGRMDLISLEEEFREGDVIRSANAMPNAKIDDLIFLEDNSCKKEWSYSQVSENYSLNSKRLLNEHFCKSLNDIDIGIVNDIVAEYEESAKINRLFLQEKFLKTLRPRLIGTYDESVLQKTLKESYTAPYVSNLPNVLDLNPIYLAEHERSFQVFRGEQYDWIDIDESKSVVRKLDYSHLVEGICRFDTMDIESIRTSDTILAFKKLMKPSVEKNDKIQKELRQLFIEANILIERRVMERFPGLLTTSESAQNLNFSRKMATLRGESNTAIDLFTLGVSAVDALSGGVLALSKIIFDILPLDNEFSKVNSERNIIASHMLGLEDLKTTLRVMDKDDETSIPITIKNTRGFKQESMTG